MSGRTLLFETFREEATDLLNELAQLIEAQRQGKADPAAWVDARRVTHNLKGASLTVGAQRIAEPCHALEDEFEALAQSRVPPSADQIDRWLSLVTELQSAVEDPNLMPPSQAPAEPAAPVETTIRVGTRRLDDVMGHVREVALTQARLGRHHAGLQEAQEELERALASGAPVDELLRVLGAQIREGRQHVMEFGYLVDALHASVNQIRMTPLEGMVALWQRTIRETAHDLDRPTELDISVEGVEVDVHLYELLKDPILHILRNSVAHGIEPSGERQAKGKPRAGRVRVVARADGAFVKLTASDDGRGIDAERVARRAVERELISQEAAEAMTDAEKRALIFLPGFSTADVVTAVSGRGIGLHAVQRNIEELGGSVAVSPAPELGGTTFEIRIPATILSVKGLLVQSGAVIYALALSEVTQVAALSVDDLERSEGAPVFRDAAGQPVRVRWLDVLLGYPARPPDSRMHIVVLRRAGLSLGLVVDSVLGEREFVTRPLPWNLDATGGINGALILPDGSVALCLDTSKLFATAQKTRAGQQAGAVQEPGRHRRVMVVDDSMAVRTLEAQTLGSAGYEVSVFPDGQRAWDALEKGQFELVVTDVQMPGMDGFELTRRIRASAKWRRLPVVLVTTCSTPSDVARGAEVGADEYIIKGQMDQEKLLGAVRRLLP